MITADYNEHDDILCTHFEGVILIEDVVDYIKTINQNFTYPRKLKILTDALKAQLNFTEDDLIKIKNELDDTVKVYDWVFDAIIVTRPYETALSMLHSYISNNGKYEFKTFSTEETAFRWLMEMQQIKNC